MNDLDSLLNDFALQATLADENDPEVLDGARKVLASVCASDFAASNKDALRLAKELIRLTHVTDGGGIEDRKAALAIVIDGVGAIAGILRDGFSDTEKRAIEDLLERQSTLLGSGDSRGTKPAGSRGKKKKVAAAESKAEANGQKASKEAPEPSEAGSDGSNQPRADAASGDKGPKVIHVDPVETPTAPITDDVELYAEFLTEAEDHLQHAESSLLELEANPKDAESIDTVFRAYHTIKGVSGFLGLSDINRLTHEAETLLDQCRKGNLAVNPTIIDLSFETIDTLRSLIEIVSQRVEGNPADASGVPDLVELMIRLKRAAEGDFSFADTAEEPYASSRPVGEILVEQGVVAVEQLESALGKQIVRQQTKPVGEILIEDAGIPPKKVAQAIRQQSQAQKESGKKGVAASVKVDTEKLDLLVNMVGELVIAQTQVSQAEVMKQIRDEKMTKDMAHLNKITKDIQEIAMSMRMIPVRETFQKMARLVRDLSRKSGKQIEFSMSGEETELDRNMVEEIGDPLVHILRNSVDHGIEEPEVRAAAGKAPQGTIELNAFHQGGNIVIEVKDDGRGLDRDRIYRKGVEKGLVREGDQLSDHQIFGLIFQPGFSTAETITDISGRGVGMDVVRQNVEKLRGKIEVTSEPGQGTTITLKLPLTLAIIDGMIVKVGEERYIVPTISIVESVRPVREELFSVTGKGEMVKVRDNLYPLVRLYEVFGVEPKTDDPTDALIVIVESDSTRCCLLVDELLGQQQVVIKSLGERLRGLRGLSGGAILADGRVGLILDVGSLTDLALRGEGNIPNAALMTEHV